MGRCMWSYRFQPSCALSTGCELEAKPFQALFLATGLPAQSKPARSPGTKTDYSKGEDVDCDNGTVSFVRKKTGVPVLAHLGTGPEPKP